MQQQIPVLSGRWQLVSLPCMFNLAALDGMTSSVRATLPVHLPRGSTHLVGFTSSLWDAQVWSFSCHFQQCCSSYPTKAVTWVALYPLKRHSYFLLDPNKDIPLIKPRALKKITPSSSIDCRLVNTHPLTSDFSDDSVLATLVHLFVYISSSFTGSIAFHNACSLSLSLGWVCVLFPGFCYHQESRSRILNFTHYIFSFLDHTEHEHLTCCRFCSCCLRRQLNYGWISHSDYANGSVVMRLFLLWRKNEPIFVKKHADKSS